MFVSSLSLSLSFTNKEKKKKKIYLLNLAHTLSLSRLGRVGPSDHHHHFRYTIRYIVYHTVPVCASLCKIIYFTFAHSRLVLFSISIFHLASTQRTSDRNERQKGAF